MNSPPDAVYAAVRDTDPDVLDAEGLAEYTAAVAVLKAWCDARQVRASGRQRALAAEGRAPDPRDTLSRQRGVLRARTVNRQVSWNRLTVDAVLEAVSSGRDGTPRVPSIVVHVDLDRLTQDAPGWCECDLSTPLPVETVRRLACDADLIPVVLDGRGVVLDQGRAQRLATSEQRTAIEAMQRTCSHPDCTVTIDDCRIHHLDPWARGGRTDVFRMAPLCEVHHHLVHEGGWHLDITPDRIATRTRPDGTHHRTGPLTDRHTA